MEDDVDAPDSVDLDGDVDMERDCDDDEEEDEEQEDEEQEDEEEEEEEDEDEEEDKDEDDGKEPRTIGQGEIVNTSADDANTMVDDEPTVLPEQGQDMCQHTPRPQPPAPAPRPQTLEPSPRPGTLETPTLSGLEFLGIVTPQKTSLSGANSARSWGSRKHLGCWCGAAATRQIGRWRQSPRWPSLGCPSPRCPSHGNPSPRWPSAWCRSPWRAPGWLGTWGVNQSSRCIWVRVGFLSGEFALL